MKSQTRLCALDALVNLCCTTLLAEISALTFCEPTVSYVLKSWVNPILFGYLNYICSAILLPPAGKRKCQNQLQEREFVFEEVDHWKLVNQHQETGIIAGASQPIVHNNLVNTKPHTHWTISAKQLIRTPALAVNPTLWVKGLAIAFQVRTCSWPKLLSSYRYARSDLQTQNSRASNKRGAQIRGKGLKKPSPIVKKIRKCLSSSYRTAPTLLRTVLQEHFTRRKRGWRNF